MTEKGNLVNWLIGRHNVLHPTDFHFQAFLDDIVGITQMQAIEKVVPFQVELSPNPLADLLARRRTDEKISYQVLLNFLGNASDLPRKSSYSTHFFRMSLFRGSSGTSLDRE